MTLHLTRNDGRLVYMESQLKKDSTPKYRQQLMDLLTDSSSPRSMSSSAPYFLPARSSSSSSSPRPRRRASQGSISTQRGNPTPSRFLAAKDKPTLHIPPFGTPRASPPVAASKIPMTVDTSIPREMLPADHPHSLPLTPPADDEDDARVGWAVNSVEPAMIREPKPQAAMDENRERHSASPTKRQRDNRGSLSTVAGRRSSSDGDVNMTDQDMHDEPPENWLDNGIQTALSSIFDSNKGLDAVRLVSQTLPYPRAPQQDVRLPTQSTVFGSIIESIQVRVRPARPPYIHVVHAVPEDFSLSNLPTSPPSTPGHFSQMDNYFNSTTVFSSASTAHVYHDVHGGIRSVSWPHPIVPPFSIHVSVLERYIPPSTPHEYRDMFSHGRPSVLTDRLLELSPSGGCLLFIYPTKVGANTFKSQYLGPLLEPLLRQLVVVNGFSADVSRDLGRLEAVHYMDDFDTMKTNVEGLCRKLSGETAKFTVIEAGTGRASLDRNLWTEWYIQQERPRMKSLLSRGWQISGGRHTPTLNNPETSGGQLSSSMLLSEIIEGIKRRQYETFPKGDIELGVFVIRRSH